MVSSRNPLYVRNKLNCLVCPRELRREWCRCVRHRDHCHMDVEGNTVLSSSLIKQRAIAEAQNSSCSAATWPSQAAREWGVACTGNVFLLPGKGFQQGCCWELPLKQRNSHAASLSHHRAFSDMVFWLKSLDWDWEDAILVPGFIASSCVTLSKLFNLCGSQIVHLHVGCPNSPLHPWGVGKINREG